MGFKCFYGRIWHICFALMTLYTLDKYHCELLGLKVVSRRKLIVWDKQTVAPVWTQISRTAVFAFCIISQMLILLSLWTYETYYRNCFINYCFPYYYLWLLSCELPIAAVHIPNILPWHECICVKMRGWKEELQLAELEGAVFIFFVWVYLSIGNWGNTLE